GFRREVQLALRERQAVRPRQRRDVDAPQLLPRRDVDHRDRVPRRAARAVIAGERVFPVGGGDDLVRPLADADLREHGARIRVDDHERRVLLVEDEQSAAARLRGTGDDGERRSGGGETKCDLHRAIIHNGGTTGRQEGRRAGIQGFILPSFVTPPLLPSILEFPLSCLLPSCPADYHPIACLLLIYTATSVPPSAISAKRFPTATGARSTPTARIPTGSSRRSPTPAT